MPHLKVFTLITIIGLGKLAIANETSPLAMFGSEEFVSIATGYKHPVHTAPAVASVITAEDIKNAGARNLADILNMVPGFHVGLSFNNWEPVYTVRGFTSALNLGILFMIDNVPQQTLGTVPLDIIDRVEISRGPSSALYGADAFTGAVNIITKTKPLKKQVISLNGGSFDTKNLRALFGKPMGSFQLNGAVEYKTTDGYEPFIEKDQQTLLDTAFGTNASFAPGNAYTQREELGVFLNLTGQSSQLSLRFSNDNDIGMGVGTAASLDPFGSIDRQVTGLAYKYLPVSTDVLNIDISIDYKRITIINDNTHFFPPGAFGIFTDGVIFNSESNNDIARIQIGGKYSGIDKHMFHVGIGGEYDRLKMESESRNYFIDASSGFIIPLGAVQDTSQDSILGDKGVSRSLKYFYFQDEWTLHPDWTLTYGTRVDSYTKFGTTINPRAALVWNASYDLTAKLLYGRAFREPSFLETDLRHIPALRRNPDLQPEVIDSIDLAIDYLPTESLQLTANIFYHQTKDQIRAQNTGGPEFRPENVGNQTGRGIELSAKWKLSRRTNLYGYYAYQDNIDETTGEDAGYSPHHKIFSLLQHRYKDLFFGVRTTYIGDRDRVAEDTRPKADQYILVDLLTRWKISSVFEASLDIRNVFNTDAEEASVGTSFPGDMPLAERNYYLSITASF